MAAREGLASSNGAVEAAGAACAAATAAGAACAAATAAGVAERHRARIEEVVWSDRPGVRISASFGVADLGCMDGEPTPEKLIAAADSALYAAKTGGRNRVVRAEPASWPRSIAG